MVSDLFSFRISVFLNFWKLWSPGVQAPGSPIKLVEVVSPSSPKKVEVTSPSHLRWRWHVALYQWTVNTLPCQTGGPVLGIVMVMPIVIVIVCIELLNTV